MKFLLLSSVFACAAFGQLSAATMAPSAPTEQQKQDQTQPENTDAKLFFVDMTQDDSSKMAKQPPADDEMNNEQKVLLIGTSPSKTDEQKAADKNAAMKPAAKDANAEPAPAIIC